VMVSEARKAAKKAYQAGLKKAKQKRDREKAKLEKEQAASSSKQCAPPATLAKPACSSRVEPDTKKPKVCTCLWEVLMVLFLFGRSSTWRT